MRHRESEDTCLRSSERDETHQEEITSTSYRLKNDFCRQDGGVEKTEEQFERNDQSNSGSYRKPGEFMEKFCVIRQKLDQCFLCHAPRNLSTDIVMTGKYEIMKVSYQPLYTPVESYS